VAVVSGEELAARHTALFSGGVACSAHETEYEYDPFAKSRQLADIAGFYHAFGLEIASARRTAPDFVGTELEFMSLLFRKEVLSLANRWHDKMEIAVSAQRAFLRDHLGRWMDTFTEELSRLTEGPTPVDAYFRTLAGLSRYFVAVELAAFALSPRRLTRRMPFADAATAPACDPRAVGNLTGVASE
jgi:TorA maturation chaperone TorD